MATKQKTSFMLYHNYYNQFELLNMTERGELISAVFVYERTGELVSMSPLVAMAFSIIREFLDRDRLAYEQKCKINSENAKKGGRPRKRDENIFSEKTEGLIFDTKKADKDKDKEEDKEKEKDKDSDKEEEVEEVFSAPAHTHARTEASASECDTSPIPSTSSVPSSSTTTENKEKIKNTGEYKILSRNEKKREPDLLPLSAPQHLFSG